MRGATINGRPAEQVFDALRGDIPGVIKSMEDNRAYPYLAMEVLQPFFESLVPPRNYDFDCGEAKTQLLEEGGGFVYCTGSITIFDDEGNPLRKRSYVGAANLSVNKTTGKIMDPAAATRTAVTNCKKGCIQGFGCGEKQLTDCKVEKRKEEKKNRQTSVASSSMSGSANTQVFFVQRAEGNLKTGDKYLLVPVKTSTGIKTHVLIWRNEFRNPERIAEFLSTGDQVAMEGVFEHYRDSDRIVFKAFKKGCA